MSNPFVAAVGGSPSTSTLTLNVTTSTQNGDNLLLGVVINSSPAVVRVTDTQGNTWNNLGSDPIQLTAQLLVFESPGASALVQGVDTITIEVTSS